MRSRNGSPTSVPDGLRTALTGSAGAEDDIFDAFGGMDTTLLLATAAAVAVLLLVTYRSPVLWLLPLLAVGDRQPGRRRGRVPAGQARRLAVDFQSQSILTVLVFGVGVDYALLLIARYREELRRHDDRHAAMAVGGAPVVRRDPAPRPRPSRSACSACSPRTCRRPAASARSARSASSRRSPSMITLLPALLVLFGRWLFWPFVPRYSPAARDADVAGRPRAVAPGGGRWSAAARARSGCGTAAALVALTFGIGNLSVGLPGDGPFTNEVGSVTGQQLIDAHYPGRHVGAGRRSSPPPAAADAVAAAARAVDRGGRGRRAGASRRTAGGCGSTRCWPAPPDSGRGAGRRSTGCATAVHAVPGRARRWSAARRAAELDDETDGRPGQPGGDPADPGRGVRRSWCCCCGRWSRRWCCWPASCCRTRPRWARPG